MQISFDGQKHIFWQVLLWLRPILGWHKHQKCTVAKYYDYGHLLYVLFFTAIHAKYTHLDTSTPGVDFAKGFKTWHKFSTEIRFMLIPIIVLFIAHEFITGNV